MSRSKSTDNRMTENGSESELSHRELLKKVRRIQITTKNAVNDLFAGQYHSVFKGRGMEFDEVRAYIPGDDVRSIDWNVTARTGAPHIKKFVEEREMTVMLVVDVSASHLFGSTVQLKRDLVAEVAALLAFSAIRNNDRIGLILFSESVEKYIPPQKGTRHVLRLVREMLTHQTQGQRTNVVPALDYLNHVSTRKCVAFLISDFMFDDTYDRALKVTARRHDLISIQVGDRRESEWPDVGLINWRDAETGATQLVDTSCKRTRQALEAEQNRRSNQTNELLRKAGIDTIRLLTGEPYEKAFIQFFRKRAARR
jgi:uncharacterized protein (DUF58 family)